MYSINKKRFSTPMLYLLRNNDPSIRQYIANVSYPTRKTSFEIVLRSAFILLLLMRTLLVPSSHLISTYRPSLLESKILTSGAHAR